MGSPERIDPQDPACNAVAREKHVYRYQVAGRYVRPSDVVVDAACGTGYGRGVLPDCVQYIGLDRERPDGYMYIGSPEFMPIQGQRLRPAGDLFFHADLTKEPQALPRYQVFVSCETIEHLPDYSGLIRMAKQARRHIVISTPIVPTKHANPWHVHDFTKESLEALFVDDSWHVEHYEEQEGRPGKGMRYGLWVFSRRESK